MTQDVISSIGLYNNLWTLLAVVIVFGFVLWVLVMFIPKNLEDEKPRKKEKEIQRRKKLNCWEQMDDVIKPEPHGVRRYSE